MAWPLFWLFAMHLNFTSIRFVLQLKNSYFCAKIEINGNKRKTGCPVLDSTK